MTLSELADKWEERAEALEKEAKWDESVKYEFRQYAEILRDCTTELRAVLEEQDE